MLFFCFFGCEGNAFFAICQSFLIFAPNNDKKNTIMFGLHLQEILVIALVVLLLFGGKKIPELMRGLGRGVKEFKDGMDGNGEKKAEDAEKEVTEEKP